MNVSKSFLNLKKNTLEKLDKSPKGSIDERIINLCNIVNLRKDMFTLSTCSGRVCVLEKSKGKKDARWLYTTHHFADLNDIWKVLSNYSGNKFIEFRQESSIIHVAAADIDVAKKIMHAGKMASFNIVGIIGISSKVTVELICDVQLLAPVYDKGELLVDKNYVSYLVEKANQNQKISWSSIEKLEKNIKEFDLN